MSNSKKVIEQIKKRNFNKKASLDVDKIKDYSSIDYRVFNPGPEPNDND